MKSLLHIVGFAVVALILTEGIWLTLQRMHLFRNSMIWIPVLAIFAAVGFLTERAFTLKPYRAVLLSGAITGLLEEYVPLSVCTLMQCHRLPHAAALPGWQPVVAIATFAVLIGMLGVACGRATRTPRWAA